jgi:hypothetical protein
MCHRVRLDHDSPPWYTSHGLGIHTRIVGVSFRLEVSGSRTAGHNLHALFALIGCRKRALVTRLVVIVKNNDLSKCVFDLVALLASLISPLFEFRERDMLDIRSSLHPRASLEQFIIISVHVADMSNNGKLNATSQG